jgi:hypothetical protein
MPVPVVAYEVACGSGALTSMAAALEDATPAARMTAREDSILTGKTRVEPTEEDVRSFPDATRAELLLVPFFQIVNARGHNWSSRRG